MKYLQTIEENHCETHKDVCMKPYLLRTSWNGAKILDQVTYSLGASMENPRGIISVEHGAEGARSEILGTVFAVLPQKHPQRDSHFLFSGLGEGKLNYLCSLEVLVGFWVLALSQQHHEPVVQSQYSFCIIVLQG